MATRDRIQIDLRYLFDMSTDTTFITNEGEKNLRERFRVLIKDTRFFDVLVGYFYTSGFYALYKSLESTDKIRILIGINTNKQTLDIIQKAQPPAQGVFELSHAETKEDFSNIVAGEMENSEDSSNVEEGVNKFIEWLQNGRLEIKAYPSENIHAKLYIMTFIEGDKDVGRVITGSSNFTQAGLIDNLEFNVELKNRADYEFALAKFNELWENAVDLKDKYVETIQNRTWLNNNITPYELYSRLRLINPAPFASYLNFDGVTVVSASPERFLRVRGDMVETRPIKGTRPRGRTAAEDEALAQELLHSIKDRAENVMIVDLERNDLGRVCRYGTVRVSELCLLETYATVFHLTSTVVGRLREDKNRIDLLKATFPGGSITGAPKVRAMEIIDELEPTRRSIYTGSIGYLSFGSEMDINIVIRTFIIKDGKAYFQVGGGIVYDSDPEAEYQETLDKAKALIEALELSPQLAMGVR